MRRKLAPKTVSLAASMVGFVASTAGGIFVMAGIAGAAVAFVLLAPFADWDGTVAVPSARR